jgi:NTE family protein
MVKHSPKTVNFGYLGAFSRYNRDTYQIDGFNMGVGKVVMRPKIAVVLGGGGSRGLAHIGVLKVLEEEGIPIDYLVGTSMGGIIGSLYASGIRPDMLAERMREMQGTNLFSMKLFSARARQQSIHDQLAPVLKDKTFADLQIPLTLMAVDMAHGTEVAIREGELMPALLATSAVPAVFPPVKHLGRMLADGGVIDSLATHAAYEMGAERVIAVDVYPRLDHDVPWVEPLSAIMGFRLPTLIKGNVPSMSAAMWRSVRVMAWHLHASRLEDYPAHILLRPEVHDYGSLDFKDIEGPIEAGYNEAERHRESLRALTEGW